MIVDTSLEKQLTSLDMSLELQKLGVKRHSSFYHVVGWKNPRFLVVEGMICSCSELHLVKLKAKERGAIIKFVPAYTSVELGEMLNAYVNYVQRWSDSWAFQTHNQGQWRDGYTESNARAACLVDLIKAEIISASKVSELSQPSKHEEIW
jgi:tRNA-binding EMAP/Myf-like protein